MSKEIKYKEDDILKNSSEKEILILILLELRRNTNITKFVELELSVIKQLLKK